ncbi:MAG: chemotaxis protein CheB [Desulfobulbaceae bacterium]|nr:chemotaxis protein CheB [Desulfobulbaceae bacterium]
MAKNKKAGKDRKNVNPSSDFPPPEQERPAEKSFPIVGIGASAGGLEAFTNLLEHLPPDTGMAFVLIQHLAPARDSMLTDLLAKTTSMPVLEVEDGMTIAPDHVYVIPPNALMTVFHGTLRLQPRPESHTQQMPIDAFFRSLAADQAQNGIGIILSGTGSDGSLGIQAIKAEGGIILIQDDQSAKYNGMPKSSAATGAADYILPPDKIAAELAKISRYHSITPRITGESGPGERTGDDALNRIFMLLRTSTGVDFTHYKHSTVRRRIHRRMLLHQIEGLDQYVRYLQENPSETGSLYQDILINVTSFFRDPDTFNALKNTVFPKILEGRSSDIPIRVWVPGCSTGEEAYSLAISFAEFNEERGISHPVQFFASDIDDIAIERARQGIYPHSIAQDVSNERLRHFFRKTEQGYQISKEIREQCVFARQNLIKDPPFSKMDLISCRNLLIYFGPVLQKKALPVLHYALNPSGYLMLGGAESIGEFLDLFSLVDQKNRIYARKAVATPLPYGYDRYRFREHGPLKETPKEHQTSGLDIQKKTDSIILARYSPPGLVINQDMDILQFRGNISPYLKPQSGKASLNLMKMADESFTMELRVLIRQAVDKDVAVRKEGIKVRDNNGVSTINIEVVPFGNRDSRERHFLVIFEDSPGAAPQDLKKPEKDTAGKKVRPTDDRVEMLADELAATKQHLKSVISEYQASTEELKALNEEVQSSNEELQSINEELQTSKEELQSTNEELNTVNEEMRSRNEEIMQVNNDLLNVLSGVDIPILLIGGKLQIRRFNASAAKTLNLIPGDIGRPISDIRTNINVPGLDRMILAVIDSLAASKQEIQNHAGRWYSMAIRPYKTLDNRIDGAILTLEDIHELKLAMLRIQESRDYSEAIVETVQQPLIVLNKELRVVTANQAYYRTFNATSDVTENTNFFDLQNRVWDIPQLRKMLENTLTENAVLSDFEVAYEEAGSGRRNMLLNARRIARKESELILLAIEDITDRRMTDERIKKLNTDLQEKLNELAYANRELEAFSYSVSHDLRSPLRSIMSFSKLLLKRGSDRLDDKEKKFLDLIANGAEKMNLIINELLYLSQTSRHELVRQNVDLSGIAASIIAELRDSEPDRIVSFDVKKGISAFADPQLIKAALSNLLCNAWKYTAKTKNARIEFGSVEQEGKVVYYVKDNGAGFDQKFAEKIFLPFQRFHTEQEFEGTGIGLSIAERVVVRHVGRIWAQGKENQGAAFYFTLD